MVRIDCQGLVQPGLATSWDTSGNVWTFKLGSSAAHDQALTAGAIATSWNASQPAPRELGIESVTALDDHTLRVTLGAARDSAPRLFADPALGLGQDSGTSIDPRDALDRGAEIVVTRDPALREYVSGRPELQVFALPWSLTYVLTQPAGSEPIMRVPLADTVVRSLASDVVPAEARPAEGPFWWEGQEGCRATPPTSAPAARIPRIIYRLSDPVAAAIAERIVALAANPKVRATGVPDSIFIDASSSVGYLGYVSAMPRHVAAPCYRAHDLPAGASILPLIDTRASAIVRRGSPPLTVDWDGSVRPAGGEDQTGATP